MRLAAASLEETGRQHGRRGEWLCALASLRLAAGLWESLDTHEGYEAAERCWRGIADAATRRADFCARRGDSIEGSRDV